MLEVGIFLVFLLVFLWAWDAAVRWIGELVCNVLRLLCGRDD